MRKVMSNTDMRANLIFCKRLLGPIVNRLSDLHDVADGPYRNRLYAAFSNVDAATNSLDSILQEYLPE